ncbi:monocarboxylate transporter 12-B-like isoform X2 [Mercenaria mercenaria]|uniref:monocarboxylate transporter 12-B-like isoform X2 n=1 Tax=Mercenaria mercenaria TaxID=6596 RepID=UPI00234F52D8|nr:monocarboxylate transporter 12-B-like isoform X2 [Mercenaria mercenaria]
MDSAPFSRAMALKLGYRFVTVIGAVIAFIGLLLGCFAPSIHYYYVFFGVLVGCGYGMISIATFVAVEDYFQQGGTIALTLASCGFPVGVFILPLVTRALLDTYSFFGTFLILSALMLNCIVCGLLFKPLVKNVILDRDKNTYKQMVNPVEDKNMDLEAAGQSSPSEEEPEDEEIPKDEKKKINGHRAPRYKTTEETIIIPITSPIRFDNAMSAELEEDSSTEDEEEPPKEKAKENKPVPEEPVEVTAEIEDTTQPDEPVAESKEDTTKPLLNVIVGVDDGKMLCDAKIILYLIGSVLFSVGFGIPICFYPDVSREYGYSNSKAEWTLSLLGLGSCVGIIFAGFIRRILADKLERRSTVLVFISMLLSGLVIGFVHYFTTYGVLVLSAFLFGIFCAVFYFLRRHVINEIVSEDYNLAAYYLSYWICGFGYVIGIPVAAWLKERHDTYTWSFVMAAVCFSVSGLFLFPLIFIKRRH